MCNFKENLVAWIDGELTPDVAANVEQHLQSCNECRRRVATYESASRDFAAYYKARNQEQPVVVSARRVPRWVPYAAAAAAILIAASLALPRAGKKAPEVREDAKVTTPVPVESSLTAAPTIQANPKVVAQRPVARSKSGAKQSPSTQTAIQIAIPAEAMFPPGAVPEGVTYIASLAPDGSVQSIRLQP
jgi:anti-sigma factor RsiW